ncbi:MAG: glutathione peroxidase [Chitinophagaceae bacterium]
MGLSLRQRILKIVYPLLVWGKQKTGKQKGVSNIGLASAPVSFYSLSVILNNGKEFSFEKLKGKKVLVVNTASNCGYTPQYAELQKLYQHSKEELEIIAFPANDFREQEKGTDEAIEQFCSRNYGVSFPIVKKSVVVKDEKQNTVFKWLTEKNQNGWNDAPPSWNFSKYLVNENGVLTHYFEPAVSPLSTELTSAVRS